MVGYGWGERERGVQSGGGEGGEALGGGIWGFQGDDDMVGV